jgi:hypothetical protein
MKAGDPSSVPLRTAPRRARRRLLAVLGVTVAAAALLAGGYLAIGAVAYDDLSSLEPDCAGRWPGQDPSNMVALDASGSGPSASTPATCGSPASRKSPSRAVTPGH